MRNFLFILTFCCGAMLPGLLNAQQRSSVITAKSPDLLFIGSVLDKNSLNTSTHSTFNIINQDITITFGTLGISSKSIFPNRDAMNTAIGEALNASSNPGNTSFGFSIRDLDSYKQLELLLGQHIDLKEWLNVADTKHQAKSLIAIDISKIAFTVEMDLPESGSYQTDEVELAKHQLDDLIYVNTLSFGRRVIVVVESNIISNELKQAVRNALDGTALSDKHQAILANSTFRVIQFGNEDYVFDPNSPLKGIIEYIDANITAGNYGLPISFGAAYLKNNAMFENMY
ncbi:thiol-activated cytolysin family protein [Gynurincola endophyticus]|uniref:thiol-activated cytolysin family protein n=1 Tax=Gynurincola endophyticus TaxID=2479004 RepID=UPI000F8EC85D|nr:thiol-activated cytolysin family protein [Gynurincola endophyticus]